jgi:hypothetical protein
MRSSSGVLGGRVVVQLPPGIELREEARRSGGHILRGLERGLEVRASR